MKFLVSPIEKIITWFQSTVSSPAQLGERNFIKGLELLLQRGTFFSNIYRHQTRPETRFTIRLFKCGSSKMVNSSLPKLRACQQT